MRCPSCGCPILASARVGLRPFPHPAPFAEGERSLSQASPLLSEQNPDVRKVPQLIRGMYASVEHYRPLVRFWSTTSWSGRPRITCPALAAVAPSYWRRHTQGVLRKLGLRALHINILACRKIRTYKEQRGSTNLYILAERGFIGSF
jgi:hypothetical protein